MNHADVAARLADALGGLDALRAPELVREYAAALLPVVREIADQRAADELDAAADAFEPKFGAGSSPRWLRDRAAALRGGVDR